MWVLDPEDSIMSETEDFATVTDAPFCGCDICMTRETLAFPLPKIIDLYEAGSGACDNADRKMEGHRMPMSEAPYSVTTKAGGDLLTVRGNSADEFVENLTSLNGNSVPRCHGDVPVTGSGTTVQQAVQNVKAAMPGTTEVGGEPEVMTNQKGTKYTKNHPMHRPQPTVGRCS